MPVVPPVRLWAAVSFAPEIGGVLRTEISFTAYSNRTVKGLHGPLVAVNVVDW